ncbi:MAG: pentapeptide repeat-containing protein, partial [Pikeienuella sp.]
MKEEDLATAEQQARIEEIGQNARASWFGLLALLAFVGVALLAHQDADFFVPDRQTTLPLIGIDVPVRAFFAVGPPLVAVVYAYFHLYLLPLWAEIGRIGARHSAGGPVAERVFPWLLVGAAFWLRSRRRRDRCAPDQALGGISAALSLALSWAAGPALLAVFLLRALAVHDMQLALIGALSLVTAGFVGLATFAGFWARMGPGGGENGGRTAVWLQWTAGPAAAATVVLAVEAVENAWVPADLREVRLAERPEGLPEFDDWLEGFTERWKTARLLPHWEAVPTDRLLAFWRDASAAWREEIAGFQGPDLRGRDLRRADAFRLHAPRADVRGARFDGANLREVDLT